MKRFLYKTSKFLLITLVTHTILFWGIFLVIKFKKQSTFGDKRVTISPNSVLIFGNSHTECAINDSLLDRSYVNLSKSGEHLFFTIKKLEKVLQNAGARAVVIEIGNLNINDHRLFDDERLIKYTKRHLAKLSTEELGLFLLNNPLKTIKMIVGSTPFTLVHSNEVDGGFLYLVRDKLNVDLKRGAPKWNNQKFNKHKNIWFLPLKKLIIENPRIEFVIVRTPVHKKVQKVNDSVYQQVVNALTIPNKNCNYIDFYPKVNFPDSCFGDATHLNFKGAKAFTPLFQMECERILNNINH